MEIFILKTNIERADLLRLKQQFDQMPNIQKWTIDFDDCDRVLRIESSKKDMLPIIIQSVRDLDLVCLNL